MVRLSAFGILLAGLWPACLVAQDEFPCRPRLVSCNYAEFYSGTLHRRSVMQVQGDKQASGMVSTFTEDWIVEVKEGRAVCRGTVQGLEESWSGGTLEGRRRRGGTISGDGLLAVEFGRGTEDNPNQPFVQISIACPTAAGQDTLESFRNGGSFEVQPFRSDPPDLDGNGWATGEQATPADQRVLTGHFSEEAPEADPVNGVTGTITFDWSLTRMERPPARKPDRQASGTAVGARLEKNSAVK
jgi:hypothetical protein